MTEQPSNPIDESHDPQGGAERPGPGPVDELPPEVAASDADQPAEPVGQSEDGSVAESAESVSEPPTAASDADQPVEPVGQSEDGSVAESAESVIQFPDPVVVEPLQPSPAASDAAEAACPEDLAPEAGPSEETAASADSEPNGLAADSDQAVSIDQTAQTAQADLGEEVDPPQQTAEVGEPEAEGPLEEEPESGKMDWYILKVQSNREDSIREGLQRRVAIAGLGEYFGEIIVPIEKITEFKGGKRRVVKRKLYPGYLVVQMEINDDTWFLVRETPGIGDFTGAAGHPTPMQPHEVSRIVAKQEEKSDQAPKLKISFSIGDRVKITEGTFENFEGEVSGIDQTNGQVTVMINIFGRSTPVTLEYWQIEGM